MYETMRKAREMSIKLQGLEIAKQDLIKLNMAIREGKPSSIQRLTEFCEKRWAKLADARLTHFKALIYKKNR